MKSALIVCLFLVRVLDTGAVLNTSTALATAIGPGVGDGSIDDIIEAVAKGKKGESSSAALNAWGALASAGAKLAGDWAAGKAPDWAAVTGALASTIPGILAVATGDPFLGVAVGFVMSFISGIFDGASPSHSKAIYDEMMADMKDIASTTYLAFHINDVRNDLKAKVEALMPLMKSGDPHALDTAAFEFAGLRGNVFNDCYGHSITAPSCAQWEKYGTVMIAMHFATVHLHIVLAQARRSHLSGDNAHYEQHMQEFCQYANSYKTLIDHSLETFQQYRLGDAIALSAPWSECWWDIFSPPDMLTHCKVHGGLDIATGINFLSACNPGYIPLPNCLNQHDGTVCCKGSVGEPPNDCYIGECRDSYMQHIAPSVNALRQQVQSWGQITAGCPKDSILV